MNTIITKTDIGNFGSFSDRTNSFDDQKEIDVISKFLKTRQDNSDQIKEKPFGKYDVDLGVFDSEGDLIYAVDVERWSSWDEDWPSNYRYISFLQRKEKFLKYDQFVMIFFNYSLTKFIRIRKEDILNYSPTSRYTKGKTDYIRKIPFECGKLYGKGLTDREKSIFQYEVCDLNI